MIAHCESAGDRMAILDAPPNLLPQDILEWRMNTAGYDSKFATLYYPWLEVMDPLTNQPMLVPPSGHVAGVWCRTDASRGVHKAPANEVVMGVNGLGFQVTHDRAGRPQQGRHQLHPLVPRPRHPDLGRADALERPGVALHQRPAALQLRRRVDHGGHAVVGVRAQRRAAVDAAADRGVELPAPHVARGRAVRRDARAGVLRQVRRGDQPARGDRGRPGHLRDRHRARSSRPSSWSSASASTPPARPRSHGQLPIDRRKEPDRPWPAHRSHGRPTTSGSTSAARRASASSASVTGLDSENEVIEQKVGRPERQPDDHARSRRNLKWSNIELKRGVDIEQGPVELALAGRSTAGPDDGARGRHARAARLRRVADRDLQVQAGLADRSTRAPR